MIANSAVASLQESIQQAESELSSLAKQAKEKRTEIRRLQKALCALTGNAVRKQRRHVPEDAMTLNPETVLAP